MTHKFSKPVKFPSSDFDFFVGGADPSALQRIAQATAWALLNRVRGGQDPELVARVLEHASGDGVDDMAEVWETAHPQSLAGVLWRLYVIRRAVALHPRELADQYQAGLTEFTAESVVAGVTNPATPESIIAVCDEVLHGVFTGDFAVALDRAWGYCRVIAVGAAQLADGREADDAAHASALTKRSLRYLQISEELKAAAKLWRAGRLD